MAITLTPSAARQILTSVEKFGGIGLRLGVKTVGCSGYAYTFDMAQDVGPDDQLFEGHSTPSSSWTARRWPVLDGSELDFVRDGFKQLFTVKNPNVDDTCGCGESFSVKATEGA